MSHPGYFDLFKPMQTLSCIHATASGSSLRKLVGDISSSGCPKADYFSGEVVQLFRWSKCKKLPPDHLSRFEMKNKEMSRQNLSNKYYNFLLQKFIGLSFQGTLVD